jgi:hypothetical protein
MKSRKLIKKQFHQKYYSSLPRPAEFVFAAFVTLVFVVSIASQHHKPAAQ